MRAPTSPTTCITKDPATSLSIVHEEDWSGEAVLTWESAGAQATPRPSRRQVGHECHLDARSLVAGVIRIRCGEQPPIEVIARAVAIAVERYLRSRVASAIEIPRAS